MFGGYYIDSVQITTNKGTKSPKMGGSGGNYNTFDISGKRIAGVKVRSG